MSDSASAKAQAAKRARLTPAEKKRLGLLAKRQARAAAVGTIRLKEET